MVSETIRLTAHEKFIIASMKRQAGTVEKAVLELVMNSIEAQLDAQGRTNPKKPPQVWIEYIDEGNGKLIVRDPGRGFRNRQEIMNWFAMFGTPHDESEGKKWAEFRMGRGQAFSFGKNTWRTGKFLMVYDLETHPDERTYAKPDGDNHVLDFLFGTHGF